MEGDDIDGLLDSHCANYPPIHRFFLRSSLQFLLGFSRLIVHFFMNILPLFRRILSLLIEFLGFYGFFVRHMFN